MGAVPLQVAKWSRLAKRDTSRTPPITLAATTGPTPKTSVRVVPDAATATVSFFLASRIWASMRRRSSTNVAASSQLLLPQLPLA